MQDILGSFSLSWNGSSTVATAAIPGVLPLLGVGELLMRLVTDPSGATSPAAPIAAPAADPAATAATASTEIIQHCAGNASEQTLLGTSEETSSAISRTD